ncbi:VWA domain-containing protein [Nocardia sp. CDC159]|uniref:VWA domain-containing protein n=1 Tax=Nocardia pulmonis TaxID=2951408 RepID=A0A9X2E5R8_9NOCA|nr:MULTISPECIES: VWA domain-containing protein [Nocardia]MCM6774156.1 VWA domain-containing protein [Nocardia pulmonis]MCM6787043.1 VWA domain-containing protein [Nocardia sp. CDC159]
MSTDRYAYGPYHDGPDPLDPPLDLREALDHIGRDVMEGSSPRGALEELLRRGLRDTRGLDELTRRLWQRRAEITRRHRLDGTLQQVRELLDEALRAERTALFPDPSDDARFAEARLDALPPGTAAAVNELAEYPWRSATGRENYAKIRDLLGRELLDSRFQGMKQALRNTGPKDVERIRQMMSDLNDLLAAHARGEDTGRQFAEFMRRHGQFFPENPRDTDELIDALAARAAAAQRMLNSMSAQQRAELTELIDQAFGDPRLAQQISTLDARLRALRPGEDWESGQRFRGEDPLGLGEGAQALQDLAELDALAEQLGQSYPGARLEDIDLDALARQLGEEARADAARLAELERELRRQGLFERAPDGSLRLTPKALRRLGEVALRNIVGQLRSRRGQRDTALAGAAGEPTGAARAWQFGDTEPWDVPRTVRNAVLRTASTGGRGVRLDVSDVEIMETEQRSRAAVALCVDTSWSMVQDGRWVPMKRTALALQHLIATRFRSDALSLITFGRHARTVDIGELTGLEPVWEQGTNLHHALLLAARHVRRHPDAVPVVLVVTDGEPTAHLESDGEAYFSWPPEPRTLAITMTQVDALAKLGASITVFMLGEDPRLAAFVDLVARRGGGRVVAPDPDGLGAAVVSDYLRARR